MKKRYLFIFIILLLLVNFLPQIDRWYHFHKAAEAVGGFTMQFGITGVMLNQCTISCNGGCCSGGSLCSQLDTGRCSQSQEVSGGPAGGNGNAVILSTSMINGAGIKSGGQTITGCTSQTMCEGGVAAGEGGCMGSGCGG